MKEDDPFYGEEVDESVDEFIEGDGDDEEEKEDNEERFEPFL